MEKITLKEGLRILKETLVPGYFLKESFKSREQTMKYFESPQYKINYGVSFLTFLFLFFKAESYVERGLKMGEWSLSEQKEIRQEQLEKSQYENDVYHRLWNNIDLDGNGFFNIKELATYYKLRGANPDTVNVSTLFGWNTRLLDNLSIDDKIELNEMYEQRKE